MKKFNNFPILIKFLSAGIATTVILVSVLLFLYYKNTSQQTVQSFIEKARAICLVTESVRDEMETKWQQGIFTIDQMKLLADAGEKEKVLAMIPVVSAWKSAMRKAKQGGYTFRVPKFNPRNPKNAPDYGLDYKIEGPALQKIKQENLNEYTIIDGKANAVRYFLPVRLSKVCLVCHGDPVQSSTIWGRNDGKDPTGSKLENWKEGEIHGAFEVVQSLDAADAALKSRVQKALIVIIFGILIVAVIFFVITRSITGPIVKGVVFAEAMSKGDLSQDLDIDQNDEMGDLSSALNGMTANLRKMIAKINLSIDTLSDSSGSLTSISESMHTESREASELSASVATAAEEMSSNMNNIAAAVEETSTNVNSVSAAAEEMSVTITEIAKNSEESRKITANAVQQAKNTSEKVSDLGEAAKEIDHVTGTISDISEQVNLLSLNATIEAARAGEAGKGFAVVASEIKDLASQTADATTEISTKIERIQGSTEAAIKEISEIVNVINNVNDIVTSIAASVEEQSAVTNEIAENVAQASLGVAEVTQNVSQSSVFASEVAGNIVSVSHSANEISSRSKTVKEAATELAEISRLMNELIKKFSLK